MQLEHRLSALFQLHLHSLLNTWLQWIWQKQLQEETRSIYVLGLCASNIRGLLVRILLNIEANIDCTGLYSFSMERKDMFVVLSQLMLTMYDKPAFPFVTAYCLSAQAYSQGISRHGIDLVLPECSGLSPGKFKSVPILTQICRRVASPDCNDLTVLSLPSKLCSRAFIIYPFKVKVSIIAWIIPGTYV